MFDAEKARRFVRAGDRDRARFFTGRQTEIHSFLDCLAEARDSVNEGIAPSSMIRIYQGAPGCGKTSLINYLIDAYEDMLFIKMMPSSLLDIESFKQRAISELKDIQNKGFRAIQGIGLDALTSVEFQNTSDLLRSFFQNLSEVPPIVIYVDEAQILEKKHCPCLLDIYTGAVGLPMMLLLAGLTHTRDTVTAIEGLSNLPGDSVINMGNLSEDECTESTQMLLTDFGVDGSGHEKREAARLTSSCSFGWPQHLNCAQTALSRELLKADGKLSDVDFRTVESDTQSMRNDYYAERIGGTVLRTELRLTAAVATLVADMVDVGLAELESVCSLCLQTPELVVRDPLRYEPEDIAQELIRKGVIAMNDEGSYEPSIPSMVSWLREKSKLPEDFQS